MIPDLCYTCIFVVHKFFYSSFMMYIIQLYDFLINVSVSLNFRFVMKLAY